MSSQKIVGEQSPARLCRHSTENTLESIRTNLFIDEYDRDMPAKKPRTCEFTGVESGDLDVSKLEELYPELKKKTQRANPQLNIFVKGMVIFLAAHKRTPKLMQREVDEWYDFFEDLKKEFQKKKWKTKFSDDLKDGNKAFRSPQKEAQFGGRVKLFEFLGSKLFGADSFHEVVAFFLLYYGNQFTEKVKKFRENIDLGKEPPQLSCEDAMEIHFEAKGSYTQLLKFFSAVKTKLPERTLGIPNAKDIVSFKRGLKNPTIKVFTNTTGKTIGRVCDLLEVIKFQFSNKEVVRNCNWFLAGGNVPKAILINHTDGARQSLVVELVSCLLRLLNLTDVTRNPAAQIILALEQSHESTELFDLMFTACGLNEALEYLKTNGVDVICIGVACELCARGIPKEEKKGLDGKAAFFHTILFLMLYVWDRKAHNRKLGLRDTYCQNCHAALGKESYRDIRKSKGRRCKATIQDYIEADKSYREHIEKYRKKKSHCQAESIHEVDRDSFKASQEYLSYQKTVGPQFSGFCIDRISPLECHLTGTLHAEIHVAEFYIELALILA